MNLQQYMFDLVEEQTESASTVARFCQDHDLSVAKFYYWRRRYQQSADLPLAADEVAKPAFVQIRPHHPTSALRLRLAGGLELMGSAAEIAHFYHELQVLRNA